MSVVNCAQCRRDISSEPFRYEANDGRILCEGCFYREEKAVEPNRAGFGFLRGMVYAFKIVAAIGLIGGLMFAHSIHLYNPFISAAAIIISIIVFIVCIVVSELIRLGLSIQDGIMRISVNMDRFPDLLMGRQRGAVAPDVTEAHEEPWGGARGG
ncbi:MAG: hypothetical protein P8123_01780 [bacterium]